MSPFTISLRVSPQMTFMTKGRVGIYYFYLSFDKQIFFSPLNYLGLCKSSKKFHWDQFMRCPFIIMMYMCVYNYIMKYIHIISILCTYISIIY